MLSGQEVSHLYILQLSQHGIGNLRPCHLFDNRIFDMELIVKLTIGYTNVLCMF